MESARVHRLGHQSPNTTTATDHGESTEAFSSGSNHHLAVSSSAGTTKPQRAYAFDGLFSAVSLKQPHTYVCRKGDSQWIQSGRTDRDFVTQLRRVRAPEMPWRVHECTDSDTKHPALDPDSARYRNDNGSPTRGPRGSSHGASGRASAKSAAPADIYMFVCVCVALTVVRGQKMRHLSMYVASCVCRYVCVALAVAWVPLCLWALKRLWCEHESVCMYGFSYGFTRFYEP